MGRMIEAWESGELQDRIADEAMILTCRAVQGLVAVADVLSGDKSSEHQSVQSNEPDAPYFDID